MKKKVKIILIIVGLFVILWGTTFTTDYIRSSSLKEPLFVVPVVTADDGGSGTYQGIGYTVEVKKHIDSELGVCVDSVEMKIFGKTISASIS